jgi:quercetin dioxygenase-like cupin family protein
MEQIQTKIPGVLLAGVLTLVVAPLASAQQPPGTSQVTRTELLKRVLPPGDFRNVQAAVIELGPGAGAPRHRHDVAVLAYVLEGIVENQFDGGTIVTHKPGESWWEAPGTVHDVARNSSRTERARLLVVYIGEEGKTSTVPLDREGR